MKGLAVALLALATRAAAEVTVEAKPQIIYGELTDKLRIGGKGFSELGDNPQVTFLPPMPHAFNLTVRSDTQLTLTTGTATTTTRRDTATARPCATPGPTATTAPRPP